MKLREAVERYDLARTTEVSPATRRGYLQRLKVLENYFGADREIGSITVDDLRRWRASLAIQSQRYVGNGFRPVEKGGLSIPTQRTYVQQVKAFFDFLEKETDVEEVVLSPARNLSLPKLSEREEQDLKAINDADLVSLIQTAKTWSIRDYAIILFLADTGCRAGGLCSLTFDRLDLEKRQARLKEKGGKIHKKRFRPEVAEALQAWLAVRPTVNHRFIFVGQGHKPLSTLGLYRMLQRMAERAGVSGRWNPHSFRHGAARAMLLNGASLQDVKEELGHSTIDVTSRYYAHLTEDDRAERHDRFSPINRLNRVQKPSPDDDGNEQLISGELPKLENPVRPLLRRVK